MAKAKQKNKKTNNEDNIDFFDLIDGTFAAEEMAKIRKSEKIGVESLEKIYEIGVDFYKNYQLKEAEAIFSSYLLLNPYDHRGAGSLAAIYLEQNKFDKALDVLNVLKTYPTNDFDETLLNMCLCHYKLNQFSQAVAAFILVKENNLGEFYLKRHSFLKKQLNPHF